MRYDVLTLSYIKAHSSWFLTLGIVSVIVGMFALYYATFTTLFSVIYLGSLAVVFGIFEFVQAFKVREFSNFFLHLFLSILYIVGGAFIVMHPTESALSLTLLLAVLFIITGIARIAFALFEDVPHKGWLVLNGALAVLLGVLIWYQWPYSGVWVIGAFMGIDMIVTGFTWIWLALTAKKLNNIEFKKDFSHH